MADYYSLGSDGESVHGPFDLQECWLLIEQGLVRAQSSVNRGGGDWRPLETYPELAVRLPSYGIARRRTTGDMVACVGLTLLLPVVGLFIGLMDIFKPPPRRWQGGALLATSMLAIVITSLLVGWLRFGGSGVVATGLLAPPPRWEYKIVAPSDEDFNADMTLLGHEGWEVVSARRASSGANQVMSYEVILKRAR